MRTLFGYFIPRLSCTNYNRDCRRSETAFTLRNRLGLAYQIGLETRICQKIETSFQIKFRENEGRKSLMSSVTAHLNLVSLAQFDIDREMHHRKLRQQEIIDEIARADDLLCTSFGRICPQCKGKLHAHSKTKGREVWTRARAVTVSLKRLRCPTCAFLTTPAQRLIEGGLLSSLAEQFIELCRKNTFRDARHLLNRLLGIDIPVMTLHRFVRMQSEHFDDDIVAATKALFEDGEMPRVDIELDAGAPLYLAIDEGLIRDWEWHHRKDKDKYPNKKRSFVTAYCAVFFDGRKLISGQDQVDHHLFEP